MHPPAPCLAVLAGFLVAASSAAAGQTARTLPPPGVRANPGWFTVTTGPTTASQQVPPQLFAITARSNWDALVPFGVFDGLRKLDSRGALIWAITIRRGNFPRPHAFRRAAWPPRLSDFSVDHGWEGQPLARIQQRLLSLTTHGWSLNIRVYFGTQHPNRPLLATVQAELARLTIPSR